MAVDECRFDKRIVNRALETGELTHEEYKQYLKKLKNLEKEAELCEAKLIHISRNLPTKVLDEDDEL